MRLSMRKHEPVFVPCLQYPLSLANGIDFQQSEKRPAFCRSSHLCIPGDFIPDDRIAPSGFLTLFGSDRECILSNQAHPTSLKQAPRMPGNL